MGEEEKKAIEYFKEIIKQTEEANECGLSTNDFSKELKTYNIILDLIEKQNKIIEEKDKRINKLNIENQKYFDELNEENNRCMILANNDKFKEQMIDVMSEQLAGLAIYNNDKEETEILGDIEEVKEYFRKKAKDWRN